ATGVEPTFKLIINTMCPMRQVLRQLEPIVNEYAETDFQITTGFMSSITESLDRGDADLALTSNIGIGPHHEVVPVGRVHLFNVAAPGYFPETPITMNMLRKRIQVVVRSKSRSSSPRSVMVIPDLRRWSVDDLGTKKELLLTGLGWGRMPVHLIADDLISRRLVPIRVPGIAVGTSSDTVLVRRRDRPVGPIGTRIWQEFSGRVPAGSCDHLVMSSRPLPRLTAALSE
ncbi:MAG: substrate-binding domain-containing protein, partial [Myxococcota bacterium]